LGKKSENMGTDGFYFLLNRMSAATTPIITTITTPTMAMGNSGTEGEGFVELKMFVSITL
jgi:hypothetical protein